MYRQSCLTATPVRSLTAATSTTTITTVSDVIFRGRRFLSSSSERHVTTSPLEKSSSSQKSHSRSNEPTTTSQRPLQRQQEQGEGQQEGEGEVQRRRRTKGETVLTSLRELMRQEWATPIDKTNEHITSTSSSLSRPPLKAMTIESQQSIQYPPPFSRFDHKKRNKNAGLHRAPVQLKKTGFEKWQQARMSLKRTMSPNHPEDSIESNEENSSPVTFYSSVRLEAIADPKERKEMEDKMREEKQWTEWVCQLPIRLTYLFRLNALEQSLHVNVFILTFFLRKI